MLEHSCKKAGAVGCGFKTTAATEEELRAKVAQHAKDVHNVQVFTDTLYNYVREAARET